MPLALAIMSCLEHVGVSSTLPSSFSLIFQSWNSFWIQTLASNTPPVFSWAETSPPHSRVLFFTRRLMIPKFQAYNKLTVNSGKSMFFLLLSMWLFLRKGSSSREDVDFFFFYTFSMIRSSSPFSDRTWAWTNGFQLFVCWLVWFFLFLFSVH